jgi:hypothetical protein
LDERALALSIDDLLSGCLRKRQPTEADGTGKIRTIAFNAIGRTRHPQNLESRFAL